jgi:5'-3' exonuclease
VPTTKAKHSSSVPNNVDYLLIDMNGVIHEAAQRVYKYGKHAPRKTEIIIPKRYMKHVKTKTVEPKPTVNELYECVKSEVNFIVNVINPKKTIFLAIDGVAPMSKQNQQRQRRFRAAKERDEKKNESFDSTCITAGTSFMKDLSEYLFKDEWINCKNPVEIIISDDSQPGEGEHKLMDWIRHNDDVNEGIYCVVGMDADLILLSCLLPRTNVYIMREDDRSCKKQYDYIDINRVRQDLPVKVNDLIIWSCFIGNDFLPPIPSLEIKESIPETGAMDFFFENYKHPLVTEKGFLNPYEIIRLLKLVRDREQDIMKARHMDESSKDAYNKRFPNPLWDGDIVNYRIAFQQKIAKYYQKPFSESELVNAFMKTVQWVYLYYTKGIAATQDWNWFFPYHYALHADLFVEIMTEQPFISYAFKKTKPSHPYEQLLRVIPPSSKYLIPEHLHDHVDRLAEKYTLFHVDKAGKRQEWEATTIVDFVEVDGIIN